MSISDLKVSGAIRKTMNVCGGEACIRETRHTVSGLVRWRSLGLVDDQILERHPDLTQDDLDAAWTYYQENQAEIDEMIRQDEEA